jgi:DNA-binding transcriptional LysR family regulator
MREDEFVDQRLKLQHLKIVMAVATWGSMAKAAKHLTISQPVVSKVIADLEGVLGVQLFDRSPQGVELTPYGRALLKRSIAIFDDLRTSVEEIKFLADPTSGELRIGSTEPLLAGLGAAIMERLWRQHPRINFRVIEANSATLLARELPDRRVELAIVPLVGTFVSEELQATILFRDKLRLVVGTKSRWANRRKVTLADLTDEPWCVASSAIGSLIAEAFRTSGLRMPRLAMTTTTAHLLFRLLESGRFVGHFGERLLQFYSSRFALRTLPIELPIEPFSVAIVTLRNRTISPVAQRFIDCARGVAGPLAKRETNDPKGNVTRHQARRSL